MTETEYAKANHGYKCLEQRNSDGSDRDEAKYLIDLSVDFLIFVVVATAITVLAFFIAGVMK